MSHPVVKMASEIGAKAGSESPRVSPQVTISADQLRQIVTTAVNEAIAAYQRAQAAAPAHRREPSSLTLVSSGRASFAQLQGEMGLNDIEFDPEVAPRHGASALAAEMGIDGFEFNDAPATGAPAEKTAKALDGWDEALRRLKNTL